MKRWIVFLMFLCFFAFPGCHAKPLPPQPLCRVVTRIDITCQQQDVRIHRRYTDFQKMQWVLIYLRLAEPKYTPQPKAQQLGDIYEIRLLFSDASTRIYRQTSHRYLSLDGRPWQAIEPSYAAGLYALMRALPSDPESPLL